ncbi:uncharacterized protein LOC122231502 [Panthera tigris]|uniref:uncharacterized protein LOC122231502 n=1 Tax=Panthera tigris TaxID=9694 RepID=UPI001C6FB95F|nr:uncharacterized protein LOC122231502 [Panthera tigris]
MAPADGQTDQATKRPSRSRITCQGRRLHWPARGARTHARTGARLSAQSPPTTPPGETAGRQFHLRLRRLGASVGEEWAWQWGVCDPDDKGKPTWDDCQQLLQVLFTTEETKRILNEARKLVSGTDGNPTTDQAQIDASFSLTRPKWDFNTAEDFYLSTWTTSVHQFVYLAAFPNQKDFKYNPQEGKKRQQQDSKKRQLLLHINKQSRRRASPGLVNLFSGSLTPSEMWPYHPPALLPLVPTLSSFVGCTAVADSGKAPYGTMPDGREHLSFLPLGGHSVNVHPISP